MQDRITTQLTVMNIVLLITIVGVNVGFFMGVLPSDAYMKVVEIIVMFFFVKKWYEFTQPTTTTTPTTDTTNV